MAVRQVCARQLNCVRKINNNTKSNSNGGGQECPPHICSVDWALRAHPGI